jgi:hypothetical protein
MTRSGLIGFAAILFYLLAGPAMARHIDSRGAQPIQSVFCATRDPGNPHSKYCDYIEWSKWRERGGWDNSLDSACYHNPGFVPGECGFNERGQVLFGAHQ